MSLNMPPLPGAAAGGLGAVAPVQGPACLRIGSHNVRGLRQPNHVVSTGQAWLAIGLDVVLIQETHLHSLHDGLRVAQQFHRSKLGFDLHFHHNTADSAPHCGLAIAVRAGLVESGVVRLGAFGAAGVDGRLQTAELDWRGHKLFLINVYGPAESDVAAKTAFLRERLGPAIRSAPAGRQVVLGGDFNFVDRPSLDRARRVLGPQSSQYVWSDDHHANAAVAAVLHAEAPGLVDIWRVRHPHRRGLTFYHPNFVARLDRFYVPSGLQQFCAAASISHTTTSDHQPVTLTLTAAQPADIGPGLPPRAKMDWLNSAAAVQQFSAAVSALTDTAPADPDDDLAFLCWWSEFKRALRRTACRLRRAAYLQRQQMSGAQAAAAQDLERGHDDLEAGAPGAMDRVLDARRRFIAAARECWADRRRAAERLKWLHVGETPNALLTRILHKRPGGRVAGLRDPDSGQLLTDGPAMAAATNRFWANISGQPATTPAATTQVLAALAALTPQASAAKVAALNAADFTEGEVAAVLKLAPSGSAPGLDGLPVELFRAAKPQLLPLLARLFSAIGRTGQLPAGFAGGALKLLHKGAAPALILSSYRPICLLNADYRLFAKCLAKRLGVVLQDVIADAQSAFLPHRSIGSNVMALQALPSALRARGASAVVAFLDFAKAYDTCCRSFLRQALSAIGIAGRFHTWLEAMWSGATCTLLNGWLSTGVGYQAGVKQGCPLSPALYLLIGQALWAWLRSRGHGIDVVDGGPGLPEGVRRNAAAAAAALPQVRLSSLHYADDTQLFLPDAARLPAAIADLQVFAAATGQKLNLSKCEALVIGATAAGAPSLAGQVLHGVRFSDEVIALGIRFSNTAESASMVAAGADWPALVDRVRAAFARLCHLGLSPFGRGYATAAYGTSKLLYHAEYCTPPPEVFTALERLAHRAIDIGDMESAQRLRVPRSVVHVKPRYGGFGGLNFDTHVSARHAVWAARLLCSPAPLAGPAAAAAACPMWVRLIGGDMATRHAACWHYARHPFYLLSGLYPAHTPQLERLVAALRRLPPLSDVSPAELPSPGPWCYSAPLWGNPTLHRARQHLHSGALTIDRIMRAADLHHGVVLTVGDVVRVLRTGPSFGPARRAVERLVQLLPSTWVAAAANVYSELQQRQQQGLPAVPVPGIDAALGHILPRLGWLVDNTPLFLSHLTVRTANVLIQAVVGVRSDMHARHTAFVRAAGAVAAGEADAAALGLATQLERRLLRSVWRLRWENYNKEAWWRLSLDAFGGRDQQCPCGHGTATRHHICWHCPVAAAVRAELLAGGVSAQLQMRHLWLMEQPPSATQRPVHIGVWQVVCLAAAGAMWHGHKQLWRFFRQQQAVIQAQQQQVQQIHVLDAMWGAVGVQAPAPPPLPALVPGDLVAQASRRSVSFFWERLEDYCMLQRLPGGGLVVSDSAFLCAGEDGQLQVRRPPLAAVEGGGGG
jgi:exonuclease III